MFIQFMLFVIAMLLVSIFWVLCKIHSHLKRESGYLKAKRRENATKDYGPSGV